MHRAVLVLSVAAAIKLALAELSLDEIKKANEILKKHCQPESGVSDDVLAAAMGGNFADDRSLKCYLACMMRLAHVLKNGQYRSELAVRLADDVLPPNIKDRARTVVEKCKNEGAGMTDECDMAYAIKKCAYEADPEVLFKRATAKITTDCTPAHHRLSYTLKNPRSVAHNVSGRDNPSNKFHAGIDWSLINEALHTTPEEEVHRCEVR